MGNVVKIKRKVRPLTKTYQPDAPYAVTREDQDDGSIRYVIFDERPDTYRFVCATCDDAGLFDGSEEESDKSRFPPSEAHHQRRENKPA